MPDLSGNSFNFELSASGTPGPPGPGLPSGGSEGQVPVKNSDDNFDIIWADQSGGGGGGGAGSSYDFEAIAHISYPLTITTGSADLGARDGQFSEGDHLLLTGQDDNGDDGWWRVNGGGASAFREEDPDPYDGTHNGDTLWAYRRYTSDDTDDEGTGPYLYGVYAQFDPACGIVTIASPPEMRPSNAAANIILMVPSLTPEVNDPVYVGWYNPGVAAQPDNTPPTPADFSTAGEFTWSGTYINELNQRVLLMLPGDSFPSVYAFGTTDGFIPIDINGGSIVTVGCGGAGFSENPSLWVAQNSDDYIGITDPRQQATTFVPISISSVQVWPDGGVEWAGQFSEMGGQNLTQFLQKIDSFSFPTGGFTKIQLATQGREEDTITVQRLDGTTATLNTSGLASGLKIIDLASSPAVIYTTTGDGLDGGTDAADGFYVTDGAEQDDARFLNIRVVNGYSEWMNQPSPTITGFKYIGWWYGSIGTDSPTNFSDFTGRDLNFNVVDPPLDQHSQGLQDGQIAIIDESDDTHQWARAGAWIIHDDDTAWERLTVNPNDLIFFDNCGQVDVSTTIMSFAVGEELAHWNPIELNYLKSLDLDPQLQTGVGDGASSTPSQLATHLTGFERTLVDLEGAFNGPNVVLSVPAEDHSTKIYAHTWPCSVLLGDRFHDDAQIYGLDLNINRFITTTGNDDPSKLAALAVISDADGNVMEGFETYGTIRDTYQDYGASIGLPGTAVAGMGDTSRDYHLGLYYPPSVGSDPALFLTIFMADFTGGDGSGATFGVKLRWRTDDFGDYRQIRKNRSRRFERIITDADESPAIRDDDETVIFNGVSSLSAFSIEDAEGANREIRLINIGSTIVTVTVNYLGGTEIIVYPEMSVKLYDQGPFQDSENDSWVWVDESQVPWPRAQTVGEVLTITNPPTVSSATSAVDGAGTLGTVTANTFNDWSSADNSPVTNNFDAATFASAFAVGLIAACSLLTQDETIHHVEVDYTVTDGGTNVQVLLVAGNQAALPGDGDSGHALSAPSTGGGTISVTLDPPVAITDNDVQVMVGAWNGDVGDTVQITAIRWYGYRVSTQVATFQSPTLVQTLMLGQFSILGDATIQTGLFGPTIPFNHTITDIYVSCPDGSAPSGADIVGSLVRNGADVTEVSDAILLVADTSTLHLTPASDGSVGDAYTLDISAVGSVMPGSNLSISIWGKQR